VILLAGPLLIIFPSSLGVGSGTIFVENENDDVISEPRRDCGEKGVDLFGNIR